MRVLKDNDGLLGECNGCEVVLLGVWLVEGAFLGGCTVGLFRDLVKGLLGGVWLVGLVEGAFFGDCTVGLFNLF